MPGTPSRVREAAASVVIVLVLAVGVEWSLPNSAIKSAISPVLEPVGLASGLDQNWSLFAPSPPQRQEDIEVHVRLSNGLDKVWTLPRTNRVFGVAFTHRWRKFKESLITTPRIRADFVHWVVREIAGPGERAVHAEMILRTEDVLPPGTSGRGQKGVETLYSEDLTGQR